MTERPSPRSTTQLCGDDGRGAFAAPPRVLYVEDEDVVRRAFARSMCCSGLEIDVAASGAEALVMTRERGYDVVVTDLAMPGMTGLTLIEKLAERGDDLGFVVMSGNGGLYVRREQRLSDLEIHVVAKPWHVGELTALLHRLAAARKHTPAARAS